MDMQELKSDVKEIRSHILDLKVIAVKNSVELENHMRRTELNEERIEGLEKWLLRLLGAILVAAVLAALK